MKKIIIVSGRPGTGKTYIAKKIVEYFKNIELISYDDLKEKNYDELGFENIEEKNIIDLISLKEFLFNVEKLMILSKNIIVEYPFSYKQKEILEKISNQYNYKTYTVRLIADSNVLINRIKNRDTDEKRHLGHIVSKYKKGMVLKDKSKADRLFNEESFEKICADRDYDNFCIGKLFEIDTTNISKLDLEQIYTFLKNC